MKQLIYIFFVSCLVIGSVIALAPTATMALTVEEILKDPKLETRARNLSQKLRCLVCQNQSIDDSDADLARDLRREVRAQLLAGKSDDDILAFLRTKFGDYVLLAPPFAGQTAILWLAPIGFIILGIGITVSMRRKHTTLSHLKIISTADQARIKALEKRHKYSGRRDT